MISSPQWLCAAALFLLPLGSSALPASDKPEAASDAHAASVKNRGPQLIREQAEITGGSIHTTDSGNVIIVNNPGVLIFGDVRMEADEIRYNQARQSVRTSGETKLNIGAFRVLALEASASLPEDAAPVVGISQFRMGSPPGYISGDALHATLTKDAQTEVSTSTATLHNVTLYYQEPDFFSITVNADKITYSVSKHSDRDIDPNESEIHVEGAVVRIAGVPIFYLPSYFQTGLELPPFRPYIRAGEKDKVGAFLRTTIYYTGFGKEYQPGLLLDGYTKAGVLIGPALDYNTFDAVDEESPMKGFFQGAWINDNSNRGIDNYGTPIDSQRGFFIWNHKQKISDTLELTSSLNYWSDTSIVRDFRPAEFNQNQKPDSFVELVRPSPYFYLSAFVRYRPNDFQDVQQRLPEIRLDMNPLEIADTGIYHRLNLAFAYLYERSSPETPLLPGGATKLESPRFDGYYGLNRALKPTDWFTFTPVAGVRSTTYFDTVNNDDPYTRVLPQLGFDLHLLAQGQWEYDNDFWEIHGLRHQVRPLVQYRWIPAADKGLNRIPSIDRFAFLPYPPPIDLAEKRYADDLWEEQVLRLGLENSFQTRDAEYGSRNLAWLNIYQDFRDTDRAGTRTRSSTYTQLGFAPTRWLDLEVYNRLDTYNGHSDEISARLSVHDGDRWRLWFGSQYITDVNNTNQYSWGFEYQLNSNYTLAGQWRYDREVDKLTEQFYGLRQRLGHTWVIEYHLGYRKDARQDNGFSFGVSLRLNTF